MVTLDTTNAVTIDEKKAINYLCNWLKGTSKYKFIVTTGRGGLSVTQKVAYTLNKPVKLIQEQELHLLTSDCLFVDDISCTGKTIGRIPRDVDTAVLVQRESSTQKATFHGMRFNGTEYIKFSWEA